jgi:lipopolysaccharide/colanic/teichoic acid biosynthesis glycosyltransferase
VLSLPLWVLISIIRKVEDRGPVFYRQVRVGRGGEHFALLKFRSMGDGAEREDGSVWASENDPRVTPFGRVLRRTALDELPQLWNILQGSMSVVGPRAERPEFTEKFCRAIDGYDRRHGIKPGLTGLAQVFGRYDLHPRNKLRYDLLYVRKRGLLLDLRLVFVSFVITCLGRWDMRGKRLPRWLTHGRLDRGRMLRSFIGERRRRTPGLAGPA